VKRQHVLARWVYPQSRPARLLRGALATLGIVLGLAQLRAPLASLMPAYIYQKDILQEYTLARAIADGLDPYLPTPELVAHYCQCVPPWQNPVPTPHPPTLGVMLLPLALFQYEAVAIAWLVLEIACLVASVYLLGRVLDARLSVWQTLGIAAVLLLWYPFWVELTYLQLQLPMLVLLAGAWVAWRSGRSPLAGVLLGLTILVKPTPWPLLLLFALRKDWRALASAAGIILVGYLVAGCVVGLDTLATYFTSVLPTVTSYYRAAWANFSLSSLAWRLFDGSGTPALAVAPPVVHLPALARVGSLALPYLLLLVASRYLWRQPNLDLAWGVTVGVSILSAPLSWPYYLVLAAMPAAQVVRWLARHRFPSPETNRVLIVAILLVVDWQMIGRLLVGLLPAMSPGPLRRLAVALLPFVPMITTVAVGALTGLAAWLGPVDVVPERAGV
jgi:hypothetical protein